jgi:hypothetical protein
MVESVRRPTTYLALFVRRRQQELMVLKECHLFAIETASDRIASDATRGLGLATPPALSDNECGNKPTPAIHRNFVGDSLQYLMHRSMKAYR